MSAAAGLATSGDWPDGRQIAGIDGEAVSFASSSPFVPADVGAGPRKAPPTAAVAGYYPARGASVRRPAPAVILLHGASGVSDGREGVYARQFAAQGVAALVVDVFAARRDRATGFIDRLLNITESMALADAFAGLAWLDARPEVDARRVAIIGFSYGGMSSVFAAYRQVADAFAGDGPRFAAHVSYYGPCIARFDDPATTGAPVLMMWGGRDEIVDAARCEEIAADLERGGSQARLVAFPDAMHRWDGSRREPWRAPRHIADCRLRVRADSVVTDRRTLMRMSGPTSRKLILGLCSSSEGYLIGGDPDIRRQSNAELARFLNPVLFEGAQF